MKEYDNTNRGAIWKNSEKTIDNHPDFKGTLNVEGVEYWVSAWKRKEGASPKAPALSFSLKQRDVAMSGSGGGTPSKGHPAFDDEIPF